MNHELIERYIYAVTKHLPSNMREDVETELQSLISDMLEDRCGDVLPTEHDVRVVLTELGTPSELAEKYSPDSQKALISGMYYIKYTFVLKIVLTVTVFGLSTAGLINLFSNTNEIWYLAFSQWFASVFTGLIMAFGIVTFFFAFFERKGVDLNTGDGLDVLPPVPKKEERIKPWNPIMGIIISVIFVIVFLAYPQLIGGYFSENGGWVPAFNASTIRSMWFIIIAFAILGIGRETYKLYEGRYTKRLAVITVITDVATGILTFFFFMNRNLLNDSIIMKVKDVFEADAELIINAVERFPLFFISIIILALTIDMASTTIKALKYDK